ncbi:hypothetical protein M501DRAFT_939754 [Patellaria atrata CBS 101060]|uniref:BZIP domain-containing protein n=1 Tax=Patellaria atrata CBS 101060 TaxID=1346257 RepID=A0A9P4S7F5_9PEZI|nr:hypothetical protein M501DRAFT_939754 [Patellaria atrata CBS 101060]
MDFHHPHQLDFHRPSSQLSDTDRKPLSLFDDDFDDSILDTSLMSPVSGHRRDSFSTSNGLFSPVDNLFDDHFSHAVFDQGTVQRISFEQQPQSNNPFARITPTQAATYGQRPLWPISEISENSSGSVTPVGPKPSKYLAAGPFGTTDFDQGSQQPFMPVPQSGLPQFGGQPVQDNVRPSSIFPPSAQGGPELVQSPRDGQDWMGMAAQESEARHANKRVRPNTPPRSFSPGFSRRDGVRKKNARFDIPTGRDLTNIDQLIASCNNEEQLKELKQQKRLLRNRQAALDSRQRKKKHTEELEEEKKIWTERVNFLEEELANMRLQLDRHMVEKEQWHYQLVERNQIIESLHCEKEEMVRVHTLETGELRKKVNILTERLDNTNVMSAVPSQTGFTEFTSEMDGLTMGNELNDFIFVQDEFIDTDAVTQPSFEQPETSLVVARRKDTTDDKPVASGLLLMLLLCGAFVASKSSGTTALPLPRMSDEVRAASATVLDSIFKDAGVAPSPSTAQGTFAMNQVTRVETSSTSWSETTLSGNAFTDLSQGSTLDQLSVHLSQPSREQEEQQAFQLSASQYNSLTSSDFTRRNYMNDDDNSDALSPGSQPSHGRRHLEAALAAMRDSSKGDSVSDVYTRSLLWDSVPRNVVLDFQRMIENSANQNNAGTVDG